MTDPAVSVVIPTKDRPAMLVRALRSVGAQTFRDFEVIVVDDGSGTPAAVGAEAAGGPEVVLLRHEAPRGAGAARNAGFRRARGRAVAFLDDDDEWLPEKLARQIEVLDAAPPDVAAVVCGYRVVSEATGATVRSEDPSAHGFTPAAFVRSTGFMTSIPLIRKRCIDEVGPFDERLPGCQDKDLWIRLARRYRFESVSAELAVHHIHGSQITTAVGPKIRAKAMILEKHADAVAEEPAIRAHQLERIGVLCAAGGDLERARRYFVEALGADPSRPSAYRCLARSFGPPDDYLAYLRAEALVVVDGVTLYY